MVDSDMETSLSFRHLTSFFLPKRLSNRVARVNLEAVLEKTSPFSLLFPRVDEAL